MPRAVLLVFVSFLLVTSGCKSQCRLLSEKQCDCTISSTDKTTCLQRAASQETMFTPTVQEETRCETLALICDCRLVDTPAGKERCGLAVSGN